MSDFKTDASDIKILRDPFTEENIKILVELHKKSLEKLQRTEAALKVAIDYIKYIEELLGNPTTFKTPKLKINQIKEILGE